jgi:hypothetical protein
MSGRYKPKRQAERGEILDARPMTLKSTKCRVMTVEEVQAQGLTPLVTHKGRAIVPDWNEVNRGREGYARALERLREAAYAYLAKQKQAQPDKKLKPYVQADSLLDLDDYTTGRR